MNENKFDSMGKIYSKHRPSYPLAFIKYLETDIGILKGKIIADIGSGTGILTKQLLDFGYKVNAVEPNEDMRKVAENDLEHYKNFKSIIGTAERTGLDANSVDFITVAQAFHWFDSEKFKAECQRILVPDGKVILVWNSRDNENRLVIENDIINRKYCPNFKGFSGGMRGAENEDDFDGFFKGIYEREVFRNDLQFDEESFIGRNLSASYALKEDDNAFLMYITELKNLFHKYSENGIVLMGNFTRSYVGTV